MHFGEIISIIGLGFAALLGLGSLISPNWGAGVVRLVENPDPAKPGGFSEFRATYGGLFLFSHLMAIVLILALHNAEPPALTTMIVLPLAMGWFGAAIGRTASLVLDRTRNRSAPIIPVWIATEVATGLAIAAPFLQFVL